MKLITRVFAPLLILSAPVLVSAQQVMLGVSFGGGGYGSGCRGISCLAGTILYLINSVFIPVLFALAFRVFLWGVAKAYIFSHGDSAEVEKGHQLILWGIIGFVVMVSLWGLVNVVSNTFGLGGMYAPTPPTSY